LINLDEFKLNLIELPKFNKVNIFFNSN